MSLEVWKGVFRECFGSKGMHYFDEVFPILIAVDQGIKSSILWDVCTPDTTALLTLIDLAAQKGLTTSNLKIVEVDLDVFIVNVTTLIQGLTGILTSESTWLVDISSSDPKIASKEAHCEFRTHIISLLTQMGISNSSTNKKSNLDDSESCKVEDADSGSAKREASAAGSCSSSSQVSSNIPSKAITISLPHDVNLSTIFGIVLGYPQIYWWQGDGDGTSLTGVALKVFKFSCIFGLNNSETELFSFSIPESLESELRQGIEVWGNTVNSRVNKTSSFSDANFYCDPVLCVSVAL